MNTEDPGILRHVTVGVGGSQRSFEALKYALHLASEAGGQVEAVVVEEQPIVPEGFLGHGDSIASFVEEAQRVAQMTADTIAKRIRKAGNDAQICVDITRAEGGVVNCLMEAGVQASLLILGKYGHRLKHGGLLGSNTELLVRRTHKPLLLTPDEFKAPKRILLAYAPTDAQEIIFTAIDLARRLKLPLVILTVECEADKRGQTERRIHQALDDTRFQAARFCPPGKVVPTIVQHAAPDVLLLMGAYSHSRLYHLAIGSVTEEVMRKAPGPVLLLEKRRSKEVR